jgi:hypothetical protein
MKKSIGFAGALMLSAVVGFAIAAGAGESGGQAGGKGGGKGGAQKEQKVQKVNEAQVKQGGSPAAAQVKGDVKQKAPNAAAK